MEKVTCDDQSRLFVIDAGKGFTTYGYDNCFADATQLAERLGRPDLAPDEASIGTLKQFRAYRKLVDMAIVAMAAGKDLGTWFQPGTPKPVQIILERARTTGQRLRLFYGDAETGRDWLDEHSVVGWISRSMGPLKAPLLITGANASGGEAILTANVVGIVDAGTKAELYRHPRYRLGEMAVTESGPEGWRFEVSVDSRVHARFKNPASAHRWIAFMRGERMAA